ncbi:uncharacterized protein LOC130451330 isoform X2 [Diorhabda sublineata]|uniref:uncharacterized protein LOC130451330 isoform X2 n=1 Tax=Diorhabda sublineata TaxID=1163346 RepID=UPI0024E18D63|nr:uncharacterized protein LOC130451330 isoform X2 [Diorhabda sublineata]
MKPVKNLKKQKKLLAATKKLHSEKEILLAKLEHQFTINVSKEQITQKAMQYCMQLPILCKQQGNQVPELLTYLKDFDKKLKDVTSDLENKYDEITVHTLENYKKCILNTCEDVDKTLVEKVNVLLENIEIMMGKSETLDSFRNFISKVKEFLSGRQNYCKLRQ